MVVFGADSLRIDTAQDLWQLGPGLSKLHEPICALSGGGHSSTQPEWASVWSGVCCGLHGTYFNAKYGPMPQGMHIMRKLIDEFAEQDFFPVWITGKGMNILGFRPNGPHYSVYESIVLQGHPGVYFGDTERQNHEVYGLAAEALTMACTHDNFCCFIHFRDQDYTGHHYDDYAKYKNAAFQVDRYIEQLMKLIPPGTDLLYCSDHGFNFTALGEGEWGHNCAPRGMLATSFPIAEYPYVTRQSIGRLIYRRTGGDPDHCTGEFDYAMYGVDLA